MTNVSSAITAQSPAPGATKNGIFLAIEGTDGSGKGTQFKLLVEKLQKEGYDVAAFDFPRYNEASSYFVKEYLNGQYGSAEQVGPYTGSLFFSLDRYQAAPEIRKALEAGKVVITNRFTGSNMAAMGAKFANAEERRGYFIWLDNLEFELLQIPRPDKSFVLRVPADIAYELIESKPQRDYTSKKRDVHEEDLGFLERNVEVYDDLCQLFPQDFQRIDCLRSGKLLDKDTISGLLWETVKPYLPVTARRSKVPLPALKNEQKIDNPYVKKQDGRTLMTDEGKAYLKDAVTDTSGNVYTFTDKLSPTTIAAAMARLSRRGDDMRVTILDEFAAAMGKDDKLLQRVITAYGDDSVQQLVGLHLVVEKASNLLTKKLEWGRLAAYLEQSTRYIYFDQRGEDGRYKYFTPTNFDDKTKDLYERSMNKLFSLYSQMVKQLTVYVQQNSDVPKEERDIAWKGATRAQACDAIRPVLPVSTQSTVGIYASGQALESLIMHLLADQNLEARGTGQKLLEQARKIIPTFLERADKPERGGATIAYMSETKQAMHELAQELVPQEYGQSDDAVRLDAYWPKNEIDLVPEMLYEHTALSKAELKELVDSWPYEQKEKAFKTYMGERLNRRHRPGRALENAHYSWDLLCDYGIFRDLQRHRMVDDLNWQPLSPRYGYEVPELVEEAGLTETFEKCFDISLALYSELQAAGYHHEAQYATLLGHRMRWKVTYNAREAFHFHELRTSPQGHPGYRKLVLEMHEKLADVHPMMAEAMIFVNQDEDPALTRLAAERYTQFKLQQLTD